MSIGEDLADARRRAGLTVTQVSKQTCIRETLIRAIERGDYAVCGGDFYARGHIRAIARAVGADPGPLIAAYDAAHPAPPPVPAADLLAPARPVKVRQPGRLNWAAVLAVTLAAALGVVAYHALTGSRHTAAAPAAAKAGLHRASHRHPRHATTPTRSSFTSRPARTAGWSSPPPPAGTYPRRSSPAARQNGGPSSTPST